MKKLSIFLSTAFFSVILFQSIECMEREIRPEEEERDVAINLLLIRRQPGANATIQEQQTEAAHTAGQTEYVEQGGVPTYY